jgi:hypothetical protein
MDTEKTDPEKSEAEHEKKAEKQPIADMVGDLVVSAATVLAHSAAEAVVNRVNSRACRTNGGDFPQCSERDRPSLVCRRKGSSLLRTAFRT